MGRILATILLGALLFAVASCRLVNTLTGNDQNLKKVGDLWKDVPRIDGLATSEAEMPLYVKV